MDETKQWRSRFGLRLLLASAAVCAILALFYSLLPNYVTQRELEQLNNGMTTTEVRDILGDPAKTYRNEDGENWYYGTNYIVVQFDRQGKFIGWDFFW